MVSAMARALTAGRRGIYVGVMLFEGFGLHLSPAPDHVESHPFFAANNVNGSGSARSSTTRSCRRTRVRALHEAYLRKVVDTLHDLPNLLWEVANEGSGGGKAVISHTDHYAAPAAPTRCGPGSRSCAATIRS